MRAIAFSAVFLLLAACGTSQNSSTIQGADGRYPLGPNATKTPGSLCDHPDSYRYPENIPYCERDVSTDLKRAIIAEYDHDLDYSIQSMNRGDFKIDHYIPLCMGGSNHADNLWPQHKSVYQETDPIEPLLCELMSRGVMRQSEAIQIIREAKANLDHCSAIERDLQDRVD